MRCSKCGTNNPPGKKFCSQCGSGLVGSCPKCGAENSSESRFCGDCGAVLGSAKGTARVTALGTDSQIKFAAEVTAPDSIEGERKTVTALFADIKGSMDLIEDLDPEEARAIVDPALTLMIEAVHRYDGYIVQSTGDGIFGAPVAHEDHPQRALYAALRMQDEVKRYAEKLRGEKGVNLQVRVGVNSGEVVVRSIKTGEGHVEYTPIGHSTSLASRLQALSAPGSIAISETVRKRVEGYFALKPLGPARIKGVSEAVNVFEVTGLGPLRTRLQRSAGRGFTKFVGRRREMDAMKAAAEQAKAGHGQILAAMAEPGVGKSRLIFEFKAVSQSGWMVLETFSVSHGKASAFLPVIDLLHGYFKITGDDDERTRREKVNGRVLTLDRSLEDTIPYLFALLGIVEGAEYHRQWEQQLDRLDEYLHELQEKDPLAQMDAQVRKRRTLDAVKRILIRESLNQPLMVIFEDLHWIDGETQALLNLIADSIGTAKILLLVNYRPEYSHGWGSKTYYTQLRLDPLGSESADEMLQSLLGDNAELAPLKRLIIEKTEGNPFFMEETLEALLDDGALVRNGGIKLVKPLAELKIPPTVQAILAARIDRLPSDEKDLLQTLAVIGKNFAFGLVQKVVAKSETELNRMLHDLQLAEFIYEQPALGDVEYTFKHALTLEVAYSSMLTERRKRIHDRIATAIEDQFADRLEDHLGDLARHYTRSGNSPKAIEYLGRAATQAIGRSSYSEAVEYVHNALEMLPSLPAGQERDRIELQLCMTMGGFSSMAAKGFDSDELEHAYTRASFLARELGEPSALFAVLNGLWGFYYTRGDVKPTLETTEQLMAVAEQMNDPDAIRDAHIARGASLDYTGDMLGARRHLERAAAMASGKVIPRGDRFGPDQNVLCLTALSGVLFWLGYPDQALERASQAMAAVDARSDPFSSVMAMVFVVQVHCLRGESAKGEELARAVVSICEEGGYPFWLSMGERLLGWALTLQGRVKEGIDLMEQELHRFAGPQVGMVQFRVLPSIAEAYEMIGETQRAFACLDQWFAVRSKVGLDVADAYYYRLRGRLFFQAGTTMKPRGICASQSSLAPAAAPGPKNCAP